MSPPRRFGLGERRGGERPSYFFFFLRPFLAFFAAPLEAAALARLRFALMVFKPPVPTKRGDSMKVARESRMELRFRGVK